MQVFGLSGNGKASVKTLDKIRKKSVSLFYTVNFKKAEDIRQATLECLPKPLYAPFGLRRVCGYQFHLQFSAGFLPLRLRPLRSCQLFLKSNTSGGKEAMRAVGVDGTR